jgi:hypothetical protein
VGLAVAMGVERDKTRQTTTDFEVMLADNNLNSRGKLFYGKELWLGRLWDGWNLGWRVSCEGLGRFWVSC